MTAYFFEKTNRVETERKRIVVTGIGAVTPLGNNIEMSWNNLVNGLSGIGPITRFDASPYPVKIGAEVKNFTCAKEVPEALKPFLGRSTQFCLNAAAEALNSARLNLDVMDTGRVGIALGANEEYASIDLFEQMFASKEICELLQLRKAGSGEGNPYPHLHSAKELGNLWPLRRSACSPANILSILNNIQGPVSTTSSACASSAQAIGKALRMIQDGDANVVVTGGCDAMVGEFPLTGFYRLGALSKNNDNPEKSSRPFDLKRDGFVLGEGSGILILEELSHARERGAPILAELGGYGSSSNAFKLTATPEDGQGIDICMDSALRDAGCDIEEIDYINAHGTSTYLNDKSETAAIKNVFGERAYEIPVSSNKSMLGHLVASAAAIELIISVLTINRNLIPPTINYENPDPECDLDYVPNDPRQREVKKILSNSFAFGGQNASVLVKKFQ
ncbi:MAG: beta-ketoacyl-[acyl-carrier-protein] synthase family protein [Deltaproteobacteria bacterium]|nr:beta-ketoacyl-[acyl-carrier-protein] synthase family protein [Deltaproteobacteria bacterium]